ncbi:ABC transporter permease [Xanthomonas campestris]|uniref:ABC transporter permease n=1 Tax=Xanthomonas campestris TaxID=339 RepID=UPI001E40525D|nr:ABC transporter permease [Xanthomonas campestris]MCC5045936.1 ABC transporter permease [Xanthomonas campestris]MCC5054242.1 ABC transporter permease [Xanthomonas campestris]MCC5058456.1 ABC transporter permease [Xanthomonas campestris]
MIRSNKIARPLHAGSNPIAPYASLLRHRRLVWELCKRDVAGKYRGSMGGTLWAFLNPLLMLAIYSFVFGYIFKSRWAAAGTGDTHFAVVLFSGLIFGNLFSECLSRAPVLITSNPNYVKKVIFPLEVLPWVVVGTSMFHALISFLVLLIAMLLTGASIPVTALFFPVIMLLFLPMVAGVTWLVSALGVYFRDAQQIMMVLTTALVFLAPIFYPRSSLPQEYQWLQMLNPLTFVVEAGRSVVLWNVLPAVEHVLVYLLISLVASWFGWLGFNATRKGFADVL